MPESRGIEVERRDVVAVDRTCEFGQVWMNKCSVLRSYSVARVYTYMTILYKHEEHDYYYTPSLRVHR